jgi:hypothetical protein
MFSLSAVLFIYEGGPGCSYLFRYPLHTISGAERGRGEESGECKLPDLPSD